MAMSAFIRPDVKPTNNYGENHTIKRSLGTQMTSVRNVIFDAGKGRVTGQKLNASVRP